MLPFEIVWRCMFQLFDSLFMPYEVATLYLSSPPMAVQWRSAKLDIASCNHRYPCDEDRHL